MSEPKFWNEKKSKAKELVDGVTAKLIWGEKIMVGIIDFQPFKEVPEHQHYHEQCGRVLSGSAWFTVNGEKKLLQSGDHYVIPGNVRHKVQAGKDGCKALDIWSPIRDEYITNQGTNEFFSK